MLSFRTADMGDVHAVFADLSAISAAEVIADCGSWWEALPKVRQLLALPDAHTEALVNENGIALAIFGHYPGAVPVARTTWFVFSHGFMARGVAATRACHRRVKALQAGYPGMHFQSYTRSEHPVRSRWFGILGFRYTGTTAAGAHHYVLLDVDKTSDLGSGGQYNPPNPRAS